MKKFLVIFVLMAFVATLVSGSVRIKPKYTPVTKEDVWAYRIINHNAQVNGLANPNRIWPNQQLYYYLPDGTDTTTLIAKGDNQTKVVKRIIREKNLTELWSKKTPTVPESKDSNQEPATLWEKICSFFQEMAGLGVFGLLLLLIALLAIILLIAIIVNQIRLNNKKKKEWAKDPVTSGNPFNPNGVPSAEAHTRMAEIIRSQHPGATFVIKSMRRGTLNGQAIVWYDGEPTPKERIFDNVDGYEAITTINGRDEAVYCLQGCGNPIRVGNFLKAGHGFTFTPNAIINEDGSESAIPQEQVEVSTEKIQAETEAKIEAGDVEKQNPVEIAGSDLLKIAKGHECLADVFLNNQNAHSVTIKVTMPNGASIKTMMVTKNQAGTKNEKN